MINCRRFGGTAYQQRQGSLSEYELLQTTLKLELMDSLETSVSNYHPTQPLIPEDFVLHERSCETLQSRHVAESQRIFPRILLRVQ